MIKAGKLLRYLEAACQDILKQGTLGIRKKPFRKTQREALEAYAKFLSRRDLSTEDKLTGFFEIPTGVGKTALFGSLLDVALVRAEADGVKLRVGIVSPTTNLLTQTRDELTALNPHLAQNIGIYGGRERTAAKPITIITYNSWANLVDAGKLTRKDFELLISDEAHRGTSVAREQRLTNNFAGIGMLAFTATAHFDPDKTVTNTHKNKIFEKHIPESVRDGELASYIQTQFYMLRVGPEKAAKDRSESHRLIRQLAFNNFAEKLLTTGTDTHTGDRLTDNQGAIFVADTAQADLLVAKLNTNADLQKIAEQRGCKAFAVAIHTNELDSKEQKQREQDYKSGKYLFIVGDEKFKEGFDHPPMKTVLDMPHGSLVDKAQILGRGARQWFNQSKDRWEGMVFADTIIYIGSNDPEEDKKRRGEAIARAVLASDVLDGQIQIVGPNAPRSLPIKPSTPGVRSVALGNVTITVYDTLEAVRILHSEREQLRAIEPAIENWPQSKEYVELCSLRDRKGGIGGEVLFTLSAKEPSTQGIFATETVIRGLVNGNTLTAPISQVEALIRLLDKQPDMIANWPQSREYKELKKLRGRKGGVGGKLLFNLATGDETCRDFLPSAAVTSSILLGKIETVSILQVRALTRLLTQQPDMISSWPKSREYKELKKLRDSKGGIGSDKIFRLAAQEVALRDVLISKSTVELIISGKTENVPVAQAALITRLLTQQPGAVINWPRSLEYKKLKNLSDRKGAVGHRLLLALAKQGPTSRDLFKNEHDIRTIISGKAKTVGTPEIMALTRLLERLPDAISKWPQSKEYKKLKALRDKKGGTGNKLLFKLASQDTTCRDVLNSSGRIMTIIYGIAETVSVSEIETLTRLMERQPDKAHEATKGKPQRPRLQKDRQSKPRKRTPS